MAGVVSGGLEVRVTLRRSGAFDLDVSFDVAPGRTVALLGPNGAGKTTTIEALAGLRPVDRGRISLDGAVLDDPDDDVFLPAEERALGVVFQDYLLFPRLSVVDNVAFGLRSRGMGRDPARAKANAWLQRLGIEALSSRRPGQLSGGEAQRVALARALVVEPRALLLDEPLAALDVTTRAAMRRVLAEHLEEFPGPRLLITHDPTEAFLLADEVHVMEAGRVTQSGTPDEIRLRPRTPYAADVAGVNLVTGTVSGGVVDGAGHPIHIADADLAGPVLVTIQPTAVSLHRHRPEGSPRNAWPTTVELVEDLGWRVRVLTGPPLPLAAEVTKAACEELGLAPGATIWVSVKATEIAVAPA